jgi:HEAT repeat protein
VVASRSSGSDTGDGRVDPAVQPATEPLDDDVTRRRRQVALAGHTGDRQTAHDGLADPAPVVRATALGALDRLEVLDQADLVAALADPEPSVRRRAYELTATRPDIEVAAGLGDPDPFVVEMCAWALGEQGSPRSVDALVRLASADGGHTEPLCREAAVAALGAIGDPSGLPAVLAALDDKPAIRRRAAVALAAFEGPEVDAALHRCLDDRDWQVRQVAEDLLAE